MGVRRGGFAEPSSAEEASEGRRHVPGGRGREGRLVERQFVASLAALRSAKLEESSMCQEKWEEQRTERRGDPRRTEHVGSSHAEERNGS